MIDFTVSGIFLTLLFNQQPFCFEKASTARIQDDQVSTVSPKTFFSYQWEMSHSLSATGMHKTGVWCTCYSCGETISFPSARAKISKWWFLKPLWKYKRVVCFKAKELPMKLAWIFCRLNYCKASCFVETRKIKSIAHLSIFNWIVSIVLQRCWFWKIRRRWGLVFRKWCCLTFPQ